MDALTIIEQKLAGRASLQQVRRVRYPKGKARRKMMCLPVKPYKVEREWEHAGLLCAIVQARKGGHRCGYVRVPPSHPMHGKSYEEPDVNVHGGLTFGEIEPCAHEDGTGYWFGFDCAHAGDASYDPDNLPAHEIAFRKKYPELTHELGEHYWTQAEVERETERLAEQLAGAGEHKIVIGG